MKKILLLALIVLVYQGQNKASLPATVIGFHFGHLITSLMDTRAFEEMEYHLERSRLFEYYPALLPVVTGVTINGILYGTGSIIFPNHTMEFYGGSILGILLALYQYNQRLLLAAQIAQRVPLASPANRLLNEKQEIPLPKDEQDKYRDENCCICREFIINKTTPDKLFITQCAHAFHLRCITENLAVRAKCPLCRAEINIGQSTIFNCKN